MCAGAGACRRSGVPVCGAAAAEFFCAAAESQTPEATESAKAAAAPAGPEPKRSECQSAGQSAREPAAGQCARRARRKSKRESDAAAATGSGSGAAVGGPHAGYFAGATRERAAEQPGVPEFAAATAEQHSQAISAVGPHEPAAAGGSEDERRDVAAF